MIDIEKALIIMIVSLICVFNNVIAVNKSGGNALHSKSCALRTPSIFAINNTVKGRNIPRHRTAKHDGAVNWLEDMVKIFGRRKLIVFDYHVDIDISGGPAATWIRDLRSRNIDIAEIYVVRPKWDCIGMSSDVYEAAELLGVYIVKGAESLTISDDEVYVSYEVDYINDSARPGWPKVSKDIIDREVSDDAKVLGKKNIRVLALYLTPNAESIGDTSRQIME